ncbi:hypothetical protein INR49_008146 [Caranx melampygus]|nr:hypothetical protein INR49_008146 [Caranx melampygus]
MRGRCRGLYLNLGLPPSALAAEPLQDDRQCGVYNSAFEENWQYVPQSAPKAGGPQRVCYRVLSEPEPEAGGLSPCLWLPGGNLTSLSSLSHFPGESKVWIVSGNKPRLRLWSGLTVHRAGSDTDIPATWSPAMNRV